MKNKKKNVYILGSGPTGLITAWKLLEKGFNVTIIEKTQIQVVYADLGIIMASYWIQDRIFFIHLRLN